MTRSYWFKRKTYGWGWIPARWQGWLVLGAYTGGLVSLFLKAENSTSIDITDFTDPIFQAVVLTLALLIVTYLTGEKPKWQWPKREKADAE